MNCRLSTPIGVIVNPEAAGNVNPRERVRRLTALLDGGGWVRETESVDSLNGVAAEFRARAVGVVAVCGGDGSFSRALSAVVRAYGDAPLPLLLPLRGGTMNTIARAVGAPRAGPEVVVAKLLERRRAGQPERIVERDILRVNGDDYGFMVGAGTIVGFLKAYYAGHRQGPIGAASLLGRLVLSLVGGGKLARDTFTWLEADVSCDGLRVPFRHFSVIYASSIDQIGLGFRPTYRAGTEPGRFHLIAGPLAGREFLRCVPAMLRGRPTESSQIFDRSARRVVVEFQHASSYMIDGDVLGTTTRLCIETGPRVRMIRE